MPTDQTTILYETDMNSKQIDLVSSEGDFNKYLIWIKKKLKSPSVNLMNLVYLNIYINFFITPTSKFKHNYMLWI